MTRRYSTGIRCYGWIVLGGLALILAAFFAQIWLIALLDTALATIDGRPGMITPVPDNGLLMAGSWVALALGVVVVVTGFVRGIAYTRRMGERYGLTGYRYSVAWTFWAVLVPLLNLYRPWVGLGEVRRSIFVSVDTGQGGKRWNRFGDISAATIALAVVLSVAVAGQVLFDIWSSRPDPVGIEQVRANMHHLRTLILVNMAFVTVEVGALFVYLTTLRVPLERLSRLQFAGGAENPA